MGWGVDRFVNRGGANELASVLGKIPTSYVRVLGGIVKGAFVLFVSLLNEKGGQGPNVFKKHGHMK